jgi:hypothetical protein
VEHGREGARALERIALQRVLAEPTRFRARSTYSWSGIIGSRCSTGMVKARNPRSDLVYSKSESAASQIETGIVVRLSEIGV